MAKVIRRSNTGKQLRRRELVGSLIYDGFIRETERRPIFKLRNEENWNRTSYVPEPTLIDEWENLLYSVGETVEETWNLTQYTPNFIPLQPGYQQISEPWELSVHNTYLFMDEDWDEYPYLPNAPEFFPNPPVPTLRFSEDWEFEMEYVFNSFTEQFYEEWEFDTEYVFNSFTEQFYEEWDS